MGWKENFEANLRELWPDVVATAGWKTRGNGNTWAEGRPAAMMNHHLVVPGTQQYEPISVDMAINGYTDLPGPICNAMPAADGTIYLIAGEPANHPGKGRREVLDRVLANKAPLGNAADVYGKNSDNYTTATRYYWGNEFQHPGDGTSWPSIQLHAAYAINAAFCRTFGFPAERCIHHREHSYRKIDMSWPGDLRAGVRLVLTGSIIPAEKEPFTVGQYEDLAAKIDALGDKVGPVSTWLQTLDGRSARDILLGIDKELRELAQQRSFVTGDVGNANELDAWTNHRVETIFANLKTIAAKLELPWVESEPLTQGK